MKTPILLVAYNRVKTLSRVIDAIIDSKPLKIYVAADGPKNNVDDALKCSEARLIIDKKLGGDFNIYKRYSDVNLGCRYGPQLAIDWFFEQESEGIIIEDDCLPSGSFFRFCEELLAHYREDKRIMTIGGFSVVPESEFELGESYALIKFPITNGWATWRRAWQLYDSQMVTWPEFMEKEFLRSIFNNSRSINYWRSIFESISRQSNNTAWDYQWTYTCFTNSGLCAIPRRSLIKNIGWGADATHSKKSDTLHSAVNRHEMIFPLSHPKFIIRNAKIDQLVEKTTFSKSSLFRRAKRLIQSKII